MLSYETISDALLDSAEQAGLNVWQSDELLDPHSLLRTFKLACLPQGLAAPRTHSVQATIKFQWDAAMTAISTIGTEALCERYHGDNVACPHTLVGCAYESALALEVSYTLPLHLTVDGDLQLLSRLVQSVQDIHRGMVDHKNLINVEANVQFAGGTTRVTALKAQQLWTIGDPIHDLDGLEDVLEEACAEVRDVLTALTGYFSTVSTSESDETPLPLPMHVELDDDRIYLRPPTA